MKTTGVVISNSEYNKTQLLIAKLIDENKKLKDLSGSIDPEIEKKLSRREKLIGAKELDQIFNQSTFDSHVAKFNFHLEDLSWWLKKIINVKRFLY